MGINHFHIFISFHSFHFIFSFEIFKKNSFEQFCINYASEKLQQHFNSFIFKTEIEDYAREGVSIDSFSFQDNQECIDLIENKMGLLSILDDQTRFPEANSQSLVSRFNQQHKSHSNFPHKRGLLQTEFCIHHFAGEVKQKFFFNFFL